MNYTEWRDILYSVFQMHNETINIWTHLGGFIVYFIVLLVFGFSQWGEGHANPLNSMNRESVYEFFTFNDHGWDFGFIES